MSDGARCIEEVETSMCDVAAVDVVVRGRVQGVWFRASTRDVADRYGVSGWVRNEPDGTVRAHLEGPTGGVDAVLDWMRGGGPPRAHVTAVETSTAVADASTDGFHVR
jgi:acylphosphatase